MRSPIEIDDQEIYPEPNFNKLKKGYQHKKLMEMLRNRAKQRFHEKFGYYNPEEGLEIWYCRNCGCMCAGDKTTQMCAICNNLTPKQRGEIRNDTDH